MPSSTFTLSTKDAASDERGSYGYRSASPLISSQGCSNLSKQPSVISDWWSIISEDDTRTIAASAIDTPTLTSTRLLTAENLDEHDRATQCPVKDEEESENVDRLKSTFESLGVNVPDSIITKMLPYFDTTTPMERILAAESLLAGNEGLGVMETRGMENGKTEINQGTLQATRFSLPTGYSGLTY